MTECAKDLGRISAYLATSLDLIQQLELSIKNMESSPAETDLKKLEHYVEMIACFVKDAQDIALSGKDEK